MRLNDEQYAQLVERLKERGYRRSTAGFNKADHYWYMPCRKEDSDIDRGYQIILSVFDWSKYPDHRTERYGIEFEMTMNHQTSMDFARCDIMLMKDDMLVEEFETYCERLYDAMRGIFPKRPEREEDPFDGLKPESPGPDENGN